METYAVSGLSFRYPGQDRPALCGLSFSVRQGEFVALAGPSGCGKTTLLRQLKSVLAPHGARSGEIRFMGRPLDETDRRTQSARIGFVQQSPDNQIVTDKVWHELAFGLESLGYDTQTIRARVAEMASFFGIQTWFYKSVTELSGGQKQLLNLASVMVMQPSVLILDEPTGRLDPIAASDFLAAVGKINRELGTTVVMTEHRLEEVFPLSDRVLVMDGGKLIAQGTPRDVGETLKSAGHSMFLAMPAAMRVWAAVDSGAPCPVTVRDGRDWLTDFAAKKELARLPAAPPPAHSDDAAIALSDVWFRYEKEQPDVIKGLSLTLHRGEFLAVLGGNGVGKTTMLGVICALRRAYRGAARVNGRVGALPQEPQALFVKKTVREELLEVLADGNLPEQARAERFSRAVALCRLGELLDRHPYDLSGGEQQRAALAKVLLLDPEILLLDEPTKGLDARFKQVLAAILKSLRRRGVTVLMVSHDVEFCAEYADRCALFFDGTIVAEGTPRAFFSGNSFYTTSANRMARSVLPQAVTAAEVIAACGGQVPPPLETPDSAPPSAMEVPAAAPPSASEIPAAAPPSVPEIPDPAPPSASKIPQEAPPPPAKDSPNVRPQKVARRKPSKRTAVAAALILLFIPLTLLAGVYALDGKSYHLISPLILLETMLPFFLVFEGRRPQARELVVIAVLCAVGVAGRAAFFMLPQFKPVMALTIIAGAALGGETGFLVGSMTMLASNILFSQGPWTPWQMFGMGIIGFLAGVLFGGGVLRRRRTSLCVFGALCAIFVYGGIMNFSSALLWTHALNWKILMSYYAAGFPMDCVHAAATWLFLWLAAAPMLEKLDRLKTKYGLVEAAPGPDETR